MGEKRYMISDASKLIEVESHVLRYWENELDINIPRNEMGHRYYTETLIQLLCKIKILKERGFQLKAIKMVVPVLLENPDADIDTLEIMKDEVSGIALQRGSDIVQEPSDKMKQFEAIIGGIVTKALRENNGELGKAVGEQVSENVIKEMDYMMRLQDERAEERYRRFDEILRNYQTGRRELAATREKKGILRMRRKKDC